MMSEKQAKRSTPRFKFQVVMEVLRGTKAIGQVARSSGVHPVTLTHWQKEFIEKGPEIFSQQTTIQEYERRSEELERLIGHKEVEGALLKNFLAGSSPPGEKVELTRAFRDEYGLNRVLMVLGLSKGTWFYAQKRQSYEERHSGLRKALLEIARAHPEYGYRRTNAELRARGIQVNKKVVARLDTCWDLAVIKRVRKPKTSSLAKLLKETGPRINLVANLSSIDDFEVLDTDFAEILFDISKRRAK